MLARVLIFVGAAAVIAVAVPKVAPELVRAATGEAAVEDEASTRARRLPSPSAPRQPRQVAIAADRTGHFRVQANVTGHRVAFLVDTGATTVALNGKTAARLGIRPTPAAYVVRVSTANGVVRAAPVKLASVSIGHIRLRGVDALVMEGDALSVNLLGMSFLGRLTRFNVAGNQLVMMQ